MERDQHLVRKAKLFWNGRSQAVRLPKDFRFEGDAVEIRREGEAVILEPVKKRQWPKGFWSWVDRNREQLELGDVEPLKGDLLSISLDVE